MREIIEGRTWVGKHILGIEFFQQFEGSGAMAYRSNNSIQTGTVSIRQGMLCQSLDGTALSKDLCGYVYKNPTGTAENQDEYIAALPASLRYFTVTR